MEQIEVVPEEDYLLRSIFCIFFEGNQKFPVKKILATQMEHVT
jgi:hypothetical protein